MGIRTVKPTSPARRYLTYVTYEELTKKEPEKRLLTPKRRTNGRNVYGRITVRHRGGGAKRMRREVDFRREKTGRPALPERGLARTTPRQGRRLRDAEAALERSAHGQPRLHGDDRAGRQSRPRERLDRQGGAGALAGLSPDRPGRGDEPRRSSDG